MLKWPSLVSVSVADIGTRAGYGNYYKLFINFNVFKILRASFRRILDIKHALKVKQR